MVSRPERARIIPARSEGGGAAAKRRILRQSRVQAFASSMRKARIIDEPTAAALVKASARSGSIVSIPPL